MANEQLLKWPGAENIREIRLDRLIRENLPDLSWSRIRNFVVTGKLSINGSIVLDPATMVRPNDSVAYRATARRIEGQRATTIPILHVDSQIVVVNKPAGISTVPYDEEERGTLYQSLRSQLAGKTRRSPVPLHVVHRIDKETSGVVVFARTHAALLHFKQLFRVHDIDRRYIALVYGLAQERTFRSRLIADRGDGKRGSTSNQKLGREAVTHVRPLERFASATLLECRLETGRTHQIRIHLAEAGYPLFGERVYAKGAPVLQHAPRLMLHAKTLGFRHPTTDERMSFNVDIPGDMSDFLLRLRGAS